MKRISLQVSERQLGHSERLTQMREMARVHERQLTSIRAHHQQLEQQREGEQQRVRPTVIDIQIRNLVSFYHTHFEDLSKFDTHGHNDLK